MNDTLKMTSWNVRDLGNPHRAQLVQNWRPKFADDLDTCLDIMALQELQANVSTVKFQLGTIIPTGKFLVDCTPKGKVRSTIIVKPGLVILDQGVKGDGTLT
jgi:hypothetical protein